MRSIMAMALLSLSACATVPSGQPMLVWSDEFDGPAIDPAKWSFDVDCWGGGNDERQCYTDRAKNARIEDGALVIEAHREDFTGPAVHATMVTPQNAGTTQTKPFTSAELLTRGKAAWKYGRISVRAELPQGQGTWPAIWMLPEDWSRGPWPLSGEIDIMEAVNLGVPSETCPGGKENTVLGTLHFGELPPNTRHKGDETPYPPILSGFHTYTLDWTPEEMVWTVDGSVFARRQRGDWYTAAAPNDRDAPFDAPFHLILNLAIGGRLPEGRGLGGVDETGFPKRMRVDWVRVWQCGPEAGNRPACAR